MSLDIPSFMRLAVVSLAIVTLAGCGGSSGEKTRTVTVIETAEPAQTDTPSPTSTQTPQPSDDLGKSVSSGGIVLKVVDVRASKTLTYQGGVQSDLTPDAETRTVRAKQGGSYVYVKTKLTNKTKAGIDLTCGFPVDAKLIDDQGRQFSPDDGISQLAGNPDCNDMLQPGFRTVMTWVYLVPPGARLSTFNFADVTNFNAPPKDPGVVRLPAKP